ncbi:hypothetical protein E2320_002791, partial [Naja naja]
APDKEWTTLSPNAIQALYQGIEHWVRGTVGAEVTTASVLKLYCNPSQMKGGGLLDIKQEGFERGSGERSTLALQSGHWEVLLTDSLKIAWLLLKEWDLLQFWNGVVYWKGLSDGLKEKWQLFHPEKHREVVLTTLNNNHGYLGPERTFKLLRDQFYWPCMRAEEGPVGAAFSKRSNGAKPDTSGQGNVLVVTDHLTCYAQAFPTKNNGQ